MKEKRLWATILGALGFLCGVLIAAVYVKGYADYLQAGADPVTTFLTVLTGILFGLVLIAFGAVVILAVKKTRPVLTACLAAISAAWAFSLLYNYLKAIPSVGWQLITMSFDTFENGIFFTSVLVGLILGIWGCFYAAGSLKRLRSQLDEMEAAKCVLAEPCAAGEEAKDTV